MVKQKKQLVVVGSVAFDTITTPYSNIRRALGGSAVYFSCAGRFFIPIQIVGVVGTDFEQKNIKLLNRLGVNTDGIQIQKGKTFHWQGRYENDFNTAITEKTELNVFAQFKPILNATQKSTPYLFLANIHPKLQLDVLRQCAKPRWVAADTMNFWIENNRSDLVRVLKRVSIVLMNDAELKQFTGKNQLRPAVNAIMKLGPELVVVKRGEYGAWCFTKSGHIAVPAYLLDDVKDPTGAGDSFAGGFLGYLTQYPKITLKTVREAAIYGSLIAAFNVESFSVHKLANLQQASIKKRLTSYKKMLV